MSGSYLDFIKNLAPTIVQLAPEQDRAALGVEFDAKIRELEAQQKETKAAAELATADAQTKADYKCYKEAMAKGIPQLAKGIVNAVTAAKSGDPFAAISAFSMLIKLFSAKKPIVSEVGGRRHYIELYTIKP